MKAAITTRYGPPEVLKIRDVPTPLPADDEVLIKVYASSVNPLDGYLIRGPLFFLPALAGLFKPKHRIAGADIAGKVEAAGKDVTGFQPGDEVFGGAWDARGTGGFAEYVCARPECLSNKPDNITFEEAAAVPVAAITALQGLRDQGAIQAGQTVLIDGASGGVGTFAVQLAKWFGAEVTAVCSSRNLHSARSLGADHVLDYAREDFTKGGRRYDLILGVNAHHSPFDYRRALKPGGIFVLIGGNLGRILQGLVLGPLLSRLGARKMRFFLAKMNAPDLALLGDLLANRTIIPVIDRRYGLSDITEAVRYREEGHARGKVVITVVAGTESSGKAVKNG
jgi:NADPH:quinone reductase-like Zn-dependent oxidoreductase